MSAVYEVIGRIVVRFVLIRYRRQIRIAAAVAIASLVIGGILAANRDVEEG